MKSRFALAFLVLVAVAFAAPQASAAGGSCASPTPITTSPYTDAAGNTTGMAATISSVPSPLCSQYPGTNAAGPEAVYHLIPGTSSSLTFSVAPSVTYDPLIYILTTCGSSASCVTGADQQSTGGTETITPTLTAGTQYFFYVDSFYAATDPRGSGTYTLSITGTLPAELVDFRVD